MFRRMRRLVGLVLRRVVGVVEAGLPVLRGRSLRRGILELGYLVLVRLRWRREVREV